MLPAVFDPLLEHHDTSRCPMQGIGRKQSPKVEGGYPLFCCGEGFKG
jgi:hypothetical protein